MFPWGDPQILIQEQQAEIMRQLEKRRLIREALQARQSSGGSFLDRVVLKGRALLVCAVRRLQGVTGRLKQIDRTSAPGTDPRLPVRFGGLEKAGPSTPSPKANCGGRADV